MVNGCSILASAIRNFLASFVILGGSVVKDAVLELSYEGQKCGKYQT